jgi:hypothetical protein
MEAPQTKRKRIERPEFHAAASGVELADIVLVDTDCDRRPWKSIVGPDTTGTDRPEWIKRQLDVLDVLDVDVPLLEREPVDDVSAVQEERGSRIQGDIAEAEAAPGIGVEH